MMMDLLCDQFHNIYKSLCCTPETNTELCVNCTIIFKNRSGDYIYVVYFWAVSSVPLIYLSILSSILHCFDYCSFRVSLKVT